MRASQHKHRDIARSILPSTARRPVRRELAAAKRRHRRLIRADLRALASEVARDVDRCLDATVDLVRTADAEINDLRRYRRAADKLNHFERWAVRVTRDLPIADRRSHLRALLPDGLIGEHALTHLDLIPEITPPTQWTWWSDWDPEAEVRRARAGRAALAADLRRALAVPGGHRAVNAALRAAEVAEAPDAPPGRRLLGHHDVDGFVDHVWGDPDGPRPRGWRCPRPTPDHARVVAVLATLR